MNLPSCSICVTPVYNPVGVKVEGLRTRGTYSGDIPIDIADSDSVSNRVYISLLHGEFGLTTLRERHDDYGYIRLPAMRAR